MPKQVIVFTNGEIGGVGDDDINLKIIQFENLKMNYALFVLAVEMILVSILINSLLIKIKSLQSG